MRVVREKEVAVATFAEGTALIRTLAGVRRLSQSPNGLASSSSSKSIEIRDNVSDLGICEEGKSGHSFPPVLNNRFNLIIAKTIGHTGESRGQFETGISVVATQAPI